ncbi:hypothetical protein FDECE_3737 [Fusarium decemcellulare]|nr:hypothetical protein FDECE_3737 [Fusarium decemcellulare]
MLATTGSSAVRLLVLLVLLVAPATGTFLQWSLCDNSRGSGLIPFSLNAWLKETPGDAEAARLVVKLARYQSGITCRNTPGISALDRDAWPQAMVQLDWNGWRGSESFTARTKARLDCEDFIGDQRPMPLPLNSSRVSMVLLDDDIGVLPALSTLRFQAHLNSSVFAEAQCIASLMTPAIPPALSSTLRYGSLAVFLFVFFVSSLRTIAAASGSQHQNEDQDSDDRAPVVLPYVSDCLHFLQFIFLTGGLSLSYPGFYPAAVGHLNWFALFADLALPIKSFVPGPPDLVRMASTYPGVRDGLYEVNGTYGGSFGIEVMTQMVGAPMTCDTWLLMVLFTVCIAAVLGLFLWMLETVRPRNVLGLPLLGPGAGVGRWAFATRIGNGVLRLVVSYITLPLIAMSTYQLNFSGSLGAGHMWLAIVVLLLIILSFAWLAVRLPVASLGALVFESRHPYRRLKDDAQHDEALEEVRQARRDHWFVMALFVLNIIRGLTVGGLQKWGLVQLVVLMTCETVMLVAIRVCRPFPLLSVGFVATLLRLAILACFIPFASPPSEIFKSKNISAYVALCLYVAGLIGVFLVPSGWHLCRLALRGSSPLRGCDFGQVGASTCNAPSYPRSCSLADAVFIQDVPVISLRQLQRREAPGPRQADDLGTTDSPPLPIDESFTRSHDSLISPFYRSPRSPVPTTPGEATRVSDNGSRVLSPSSLTSYLTEYPPSNEEEHLGSMSVASEAASSTPLGPRWDDYSFREADLFYARPPPSEAMTARQPLPASASASSASQKSSGWSLLSAWNLSGWKPKPPEEKGFSVVRPNRVSHFTPPPTTGATTLGLEENKPS